MTVPLLNSLPTKREMRDRHEQRGVAGEEGQQLAGGAELVVACGNAFHGHIHARVVEGGLLLCELGFHGVPGQLVGEVQQIRQCRQPGGC